MALINCMECGREVSDKAVVCPNCGVDIQRQMISIKAERIAELGRENHVKPEGSKLKAADKIAATFLLGLLVFVIGAALSSAFIIIADVIVSIFVTMVFLEEGKSENMTDEEFRSYKVEQEKKRIEESELRKLAKRCPSCGSDNTTEIGTISKTAGVATVGLASKSIGKNMRCKSCGCRW